MIEAILEVARWAPSTDNTQPWRFEVKSDGHLVVHGFDTRGHCVYDRDGRVSQLSLGALLETIRIAATGHRLRCVAEPRTGLPETHPTFDVRFSTDPDIQTDPLLAFVKVRSVQRRPLSMRPLTVQQISRLEASVGSGFEILWLASWKERLRMSRMLFLNGQLRLKLPEAFEVHRSVIEWDACASASRLPDRAIGLDPVTLRLTRWAMASRARVTFLDRYLAGTLVPCLELDFIPGIACASHFVIMASAPPRKVDHYIGAGGALQRFWLTATQLGLLMQPEVSPLVFARYHREQTHYTASASCRTLGHRVVKLLSGIAGAGTLERAVFMGRIGAGNAPKARSTRLALSELMVSTAERAQGN